MEYAVVHIVRGANMENPYAAGELTPELVAEERRRPKVSRGLLLAYGVHHVASLAGLFFGLLFKPSGWSIFFPREKPVEVLQTLVLIPVIDLYLMAVPFLAILIPDRFGAALWFWLRAIAVFTIPIAVIIYGGTRRKWWLWYIGVVSFAVYASMALSNLMEQGG